MFVLALAGIGAATAQAGGPPPDPGLPPNLTCVVPDVYGLPFQTAKRKLAAAKCGKGWTFRAYSDKVKKGRVLLQVPAAGSHLRIGTGVDLTLSRGRR